MAGMPTARASVIEQILTHLRTRTSAPAPPLGRGPARGARPRGSSSRAGPGRHTCHPSSRCRGPHRILQRPRFNFLFCVVNFIKSTWESQHDVRGVSVDAGLFFVAPGVLLGCQSFMLIGPLLVLIQTRESGMAQPWVMTIATANPRRRLLEAALLVISSTWILLPIAIAVAQGYQGVELHTFERMLGWFGISGLAFAATANAVAMYKLRRLRRAVARPP